MLQGCAELADKHDLPVYTHVYETRGQALIAREQFAEHGGSLITYLENNGLLGPRLNIVHSVWISRPEMERMAAADAGIVLNHLSNMKLKSGIAPVLRPARGRRAARSRLRQLQRQRRAERVPGDEDVLSVRRGERAGARRRRWRTRCCATPRSAMRAPRGSRASSARSSRATRPIMVLIDLNDMAYLPYNSAARQLVYTEAGRGVESVIVDGRMVIRERKVTTIDEDALRREVEGLMRHFIADYDAVVESRERALPYMLEAHRRMWQPDVGMNRFVPRTR